MKTLVPSMSSFPFLLYVIFIFPFKLTGPSMARMVLVLFHEHPTISFMLELHPNLHDHNMSYCWCSHIFSLFSVCLYQAASTCLDNPSSSHDHVWATSFHCSLDFHAIPPPWTYAVILPQKKKTYAVIQHRSSRTSMFHCSYSAWLFYCAPH